MPKGEHFPTTPLESQEISNSLVSNSVSVPTNGGIQYQNYNSYYQVLVRGVENHLDGVGNHFNINVQNRNGIDKNNFHITFKSKSWYSNKYYWQMSDSVTGIEQEIVGYGEQAEAAYGAEIGVLSEMTTVCGAEVEGLAAGGGSVIMKLLLALLLL
ncbi:hypothetical protein G9F72_007295 [Clostridium estertheticum]|uniref:hypothetical protein n=1 Tax=Clostridium estertheticum TaxID=238834 RepID=UPI0013E94611|nr:hypothetical protein [Clostridium estertheticum]MBZ9686137.1 hypothetical protein [Clostridium estertheticum]